MNIHIYLWLCIGMRANSNCVENVVHTNLATHIVKEKRAEIVSGRERERGIANGKRNGKISGPLCRNVHIMPHARSHFCNIKWHVHVHTDIRICIRDVINC